jgi:hypothetical protein
MIGWLFLLLSVRLVLCVWWVLVVYGGVCMQIANGEEAGPVLLAGVVVVEEGKAASRSRVIVMSLQRRRQRLKVCDWLVVSGCFWCVLCFVYVVFR